jgi:hypothetical protein
MRDTDEKLLKFPRTPHLEGSGLQSEERDERLPLAAIDGPGEWSVEEKVDGANCGISFDAGGRPLLQSRGRWLNAEQRNAPGERDWVLLKDWLAVHCDDLMERLEDRFILYGEWMGIAHSIHYDRLPGPLIGFDVLDKTTGTSLDRSGRRRILAGSAVTAPPVLHHGARPTAQSLARPIQRVDGADGL